MRLKSENAFLSFIKGRIRGRRALVIALIALAFFALLLFGTEVGDEAELGDDYAGILESRLEKLLSDTDGVGKCEVMITIESGERKVYEGSREIATLPPKVLAVTVLCEGADSVSVVREITEAISAMFDIGTHRVRVMKINS